MITLTYLFVYCAQPIYEKISVILPGFNVFDTNIILSLYKLDLIF